MFPTKLSSFSDNKENCIKKIKATWPIRKKHYVYKERVHSATTSPGHSEPASTMCAVHSQFTASKAIYYTANLYLKFPIGSWKLYF